MTRLNASFDSKSPVKKEDEEIASLVNEIFDDNNAKNSKFFDLFKIRSTNFLRQRRTLYIVSIVAVGLVFAGKIIVFVVCC